MTSFPPPSKALLSGVKLAVVILAPIAVAVAFLGSKAVLPAGMGLVSAAVLPYCKPGQAVILILGLGLTGALATAAYGNAVAVVAVIVVACLASGLLGTFSDGVFGMAPVVASVLSFETPQLPPLTVGVVMVLVGAYAEIIVLLMKAHTERKPVQAKVAIRHGVVMAAACGLAAAVAQHYQWPHAYWLVMTLAIVLRPFESESLKRSRQRIVGTLAGAIIAAMLSPLPSIVQLVLATACMALMFAYMTLKDYLLQVTFMTPWVVFMVSSGTMSDTLSTDALRVAYTAIGCVTGGLLALVLAQQQADDPNPSSTAVA